uniref:Embryo surrounding factor 1 brassicaceae domain-containing protein n=1 Tax=Aegilops tauschii TaxID=37682 RepID=M8C024_AEGTA
MKGSVVCTIAVFFIGCLLMVGVQCRREPESTYKVDRANTTTLVSPVDESKLTLIWCLNRDCKDKGENFGSWTRDCICCVTLPDVPCYDSDEECHKNCPSMTQPMLANTGGH